MKQYSSIPNHRNGYLTVQTNNNTMKPMKLSLNGVGLEQLILKKMNRIHHRTFLTKSILATTMYETFKNSEHPKMKKKAGGVESKIRQTDFFERLVECGIISKSSPTLFNRNRLHDILDRGKPGRITWDGIPYDFVDYDYITPTTAYSDTDD